MPKHSCSISASIALLFAVSPVWADDLPAGMVEPRHNPAEATMVTARLSLGLGGGSRGILGRVGGEVDYWAWRHVGIGGTAAYSEQAPILGDSFGYLLLGPVVSLRSSAESSGFIGSVALGVVSGTFTEAAIFCGSCSGPGEGFAGLGASAGGGYFGHVGVLELGLGLVLDVLRTDFQGGWEHGVSANFSLGVAIPEKAAGATPSRRLRSRAFR